MNILFATSECAPWVKTGGLGDVSAALPQALAALGHDVHVLVPAYGALRGLLDGGREAVTLQAEGPWPAARLVLVQQPGSFSLLLIDCDALYNRAGGPYQAIDGPDHADNARRFGFLGHVAARLAGPRSPWGERRPDILHCNDWPTGLAPGFLAEAGGPRAASLMTIHNLAYQGLFAMDEVGRLGLPPHWRSVDGAEYWGQLSFLKAGLQFADAITTVSPTYAREIRTPALGAGLHGLLEARADNLHGILNGVDTAIWNPAADPLLPRGFSADKPYGKRLDKIALQQRFGLEVDRHAMLCAVVSRLAGQKGIDLVLAAVPWLRANGCQLVVLGSGDPALERQLRAATEAHPGHIAVQIGFDEGAAHLIEGGADLFLMPSRYEPCGLNQMYSQLYGTLPLVHRTGGLADSVADFLDDPEAATGFAMPEASLPALQAALGQALLLFRQPAAWATLRDRAMRRDFGWAASARQYVALYESLRSQVSGARA